MKASSRRKASVVAALLALASALPIASDSESIATSLTATMAIVSPGRHRMFNPARAGFCRARKEMLSGARASRARRTCCSFHSAMPSPLRDCLLQESFLFAHMPQLRGLHWPQARLRRRQGWVA